MRSSLLLSASALCGLSLAHFELRYPESIGFSDDQEDQAPCGGYLPDFSDSSSLVDFHVGGEAIAVRSTHQQGNWLFRVTTAQDAEGPWEQLFPIVQQSGLGDFCQPQVTVPEKYVGKKGVVSVVSSAVDGLLYQCVAANFVKGKADTPSECRNASSVKAYFTDDDDLSALVGPDSAGAGATVTGSATFSASETGAAASSTETPDAAAGLQAWSASGAGFITLLAMAFAGGALMV